MANLGLADLIVDEQPIGTELAEQVGTHPDATTRPLRALASLEVVTESRPDHFRLADAATGRTPTGRAPCARSSGSSATRRCWPPGESWTPPCPPARPTFDRAFELSFFDHLKANPEQSELFNGSMRATHRPTV